MQARRCCLYPKPPNPKARTPNPELHTPNELRTPNRERRNNSATADVLLCHYRPADCPGNLWHKDKSMCIAPVRVYNELVIFEIVNSSGVPFVIIIDRLK